MTKEMIANMEPGSVVVDIAVDQGGCIETCRPTTHENPTFLVDGVVHYCVANMPELRPGHQHLFDKCTLNYARIIARDGVEKLPNKTSAF